jgi:hypothetical protein
MTILEAIGTATLGVTVVFGALWYLNLALTWSFDPHDYAVKSMRMRKYCGRLMLFVAMVLVTSVVIYFTSGG